MNEAELTKAFQSLPPLTPKTTWDRNRLKLRWYMARATGNNRIERFLCWPAIRSVMFVQQGSYTRDEYDALMEDPTLWRAAITESELGEPARLPYATWTSGNLVHMAYHLKQWMDVTSRSIASLDSIVEIGGGYGAMALICRRMGFDGKYELIDFPEFSYLQQFYLANVGLELTTNFSWPLQYQHTLLQPRLAIATFSLSEVPLAARTGLMPRDAESFLFAYKPNWGRRANPEFVDNHKYFDQLIAERSDLTWQKFRASCGSWWYLIGAPV